jgi:hypothetical protein
MKDKTIKFNPLDYYIDNNCDDNIDKLDDKPCKERKRITFYIDTNVIERLKDAVYWQPGETLTSFVQKAILNMIEQIENENGDKFISRKDKHLKRGRPIK